MRRGGARARRALGALLALAAGVAASLALAEGVLTIMGLPNEPLPPVKDRQFVLLDSPAARARIGWVSRPSARITFHYDGDPRGVLGPGARVVHHTNAQGFRGSDFRRERRPHTLRIAVLGDSFTFGEGVADDATYAARLEQILRERLPGRTVEVQNWGVGGYNTEQEAALLEDRVLAYAPDVVILGVALNDAEERLYRVDPQTGRIERALARQEALDHAARTPRRGWRRLRLVRLVQARLDRSRRSRETLAGYRALLAPGSPQLARWQAAVDRIGALCRTRRLPCYAVVFPILWELRDYPLREAHERVVAALEQAGLGTIDLLPELRDHEGPELWVHPTDQHPGPELHALAAARIAERLLRERPWQRRSAPGADASPPGAGEDAPVGASAQTAGGAGP